MSSNESKHRSSASPSPPPRPPISLNPGPRSQKLQKIFESALKATLKAVSYENFSACFPTPASAVPEALNGLHHDFVERLDDVCKSEFSNLLAERDVVRNLNELDSLVEEAEKRRRQATASDLIPVPPHMLPPASILDAHLAPFLSDQTMILQTQLHDAQAANNTVSAEVFQQRSDIEALVQGLESVTADLDKALDELELCAAQNIGESLSAPLEAT